MALPLKFTAGTTQVGMLWLVPSGLSTITAQLRHCAAPQPNLVPVIPRYSRKKSFIVKSSRTSLGPCARSPRGPRRPCARGNDGGDRNPPLCNRHARRGGRLAACSPAPQDG